MERYYAKPHIAVVKLLPSNEAYQMWVGITSTTQSQLYFVQLNDELNPISTAVWNLKPKWKIRAVSKSYLLIEETANEIESKRLIVLDLNRIRTAHFEG